MQLETRARPYCKKDGLATLEDGPIVGFREHRETE